MKTFKNTYPLPDGCAKEYLDDSSIFMDIETTGFSPEKCMIYMIGMAYLTSDELCVMLLFAESYDEEKAVISTFLDLLTSYSTIITFNGDNFDIPFISKRCKRYSLNTAPLEMLASMDLLKTARRHKTLLSLSSCRQKSIEELLGIQREDKYNGGELIEVYHHYVRTKDPGSYDDLIRHNFDDVRGMTSLISILAYDHLGEFEIKDIDRESDDGFIIINAVLKHPVPKAVRVREDSFYIIIENERLKAALRCEKATLKYFFPYPNQYVYLLRERTVVPKMLAASIPTVERRPAKAKECFSAVYGSYIAVSKDTIKKASGFFSEEKLFYKEYRDDTAYIRIDDEPSDAWLSEYLRLILL